MVKLKTSFVCQSCGANYPKWVGKCDNCGEWNSLVEQVVTSSGKSALAKSVNSGQKLTVQTMRSISSEERTSRILTGFSDLDDVLGGGIVAGGVILIAGQPGIGKSTLLLQLSANVANSTSVLYVS